jgi:hypothetical protein
MLVGWFWTLEKKEGHGTAPGSKKAEVESFQDVYAALVEKRMSGLSSDACQFTVQKRSTSRS